VHPIIAICLALVAVGLAVAVRWGGEPFTTRPPATPTTDTTAADRARRALWYVDVHVIAAIATGLLVIGPGGRLVMRLLAITADDAAQGRVTEADEIVGRVTVGGTIGLVLFVGLFGGVLVALAAGGLRPWLPAGRLGALCVAGILLLTTATRGDPLRPANRDFDLVGPGWVAIAAFVALIVLTTLTFEAIASRASRAVPLPSVAHPLTLLAFAPVLILGLSVLLPAALLAVGLVALLGAVPVLQRWWVGPLRTAGRVVLVAGSVALLPLFVNDLHGILDRSAG
jgi:hypothetical protein